MPTNGERWALARPNSKACADFTVSGSFRIPLAIWLACIGGSSLRLHHAERDGYYPTMADAFFDVDSLAAYLHMMPAKVARLADRGRLPGRRVGGKWRFSKAEIHHWLEERMGLSDDSELAKMEGILERSAGPDENELVRIADLLPVDAIAIPLGAKTRTSVVDRMTGLAAATGLLWDPAKMAAAVREREAMHSTALDNGVALLHARRPMSNILSEAVLALGSVPSGVPFGGDKGLTDLFFLICSTSDHEHLRILARISRLISDATFLDELRDVPDATAAHELIGAKDAELN